MRAFELSLPPEPHTTAQRAGHEAAQWFALLRSGDASEADREGWRAWLDASEAHRHAWNLVERVSRRFEPIHTSPHPRSTVEVLRAAQAQAPRRRQVLLGLAIGGGAGLLAGTLWRHPATASLAWAADHKTAVGEIREVRLSDGTRVWLGSGSAINEDRRDGLRRLELVAGDILVETAHDASQPFVVDTAQGRLRPLGTRFNVRLEEGGRTFVAVFEGAVDIRTAHGDGHSVLRAGQQARFDGRSVEAPSAADPGREAWTRGILIAQDLTLGEVVVELDRYRRGRLRVAPDAAQLRVYGSFPLNDTDRALAMLASVLPVQVRHRLWWTTVERASTAP